MIALMCLLLSSPAPSDDALVRALHDELERGMSGLAIEGMPRPYFMAYGVFDYEEWSIAASFGALEESDHDRGRFLRVEVRVGAPELDNSNFAGDFGAHLYPRQLPVADDYDALRREIWLGTDDAYKRAVETLEKKRAALQSQARPREVVADFAPAPRLVSAASPPRLEVDEAALSELARRLSAIYRDDPLAQSGRVAVHVSTVTRTFVSSEGSVLVEPRALVRLDARATTQAEDGMELERHVSVTVPRVLDLPAEAALRERVRASLVELGEERGAPTLDDYAGPVLFLPTASAQLLRELLAGALSGTPAPRSGDTRMARVMSSWASELSGRLGQRVLPAGFAIVDDPGLRTLGGAPLMGGYAVDDEGVRAERVELVADGMLRGFVMSRAPRKDVASSNGHGRSGGAGEPRGRIANLLLSSKRGLTAPSLKRELLAAVRDAGLPYGVVVRALVEPGVDDDDGARYARGDDQLPMPAAVSRVYPDGREEAVRGAELGIIPLRALKQITAAGSEPTVLSYFAGGSGPRGSALGGARGARWGIPTSIAAPALLFEDLDVKRSSLPAERPPKLPRP